MRRVEENLFPVNSVLRVVPRHAQHGRRRACPDVHSDIEMRIVRSDAEEKELNDLVDKFTNEVKSVFPRTGQ
jgi:hypothetical protein